VRDCTVSGISQATHHCRINCKEIAGLGVVEGTHGAIRLANSLNRLNCQKELLVERINPFTEPVRLSAGALVGKEADVGLALEKPPCTSQGTILEHVVDLYGGACGNCTSSTECQVLAQLLTEHSDIFSHGDGDMGLTKVIFHEIPLAAGTSPIR